jgi:CheY-like chemotaxis protein
MGKKRRDGSEQMTEKARLDLGPGPARYMGLLVEDNLPDALIVQEAIEHYRLPIALHIVDDGEKAFLFIERTELDREAPVPDFVLLDLNLPKRSGREVLARLRQSSRCKDVPVIIFTSSDLLKERTELSALGANRYFRKPSSYSSFLKVGEVLSELLGRN